MQSSGLGWKVRTMATMRIECFEVMVVRISVLVMLKDIV